MIIPVANRLNDVPEYYFARKLRQIRARMAAGESILNLGIGNPDLPPPEAALKRMIDRIAEPDLHGYQPYKGIAALREAFADWYARIYGVQLSPDSEVQPLTGSKEGIMHISLAFLNPGDQVLVPDPGYLTYRSVAQLVGAEVISYRLNPAQGWEPDWQQLAEMDLSKVKIMWVNYPNMPTGAPARPELMQKMVDFARQHALLLVNDNPYSLILNSQPQSLLATPGAREVALELNSISKSHNMAGWRVGLVAGAADYISAILQVKSNMDSGMLRAIQEASIVALAQDYAWHEEQNAIYARRKVVARQILDSLGCSYKPDQVGMFLWAQLPGGELSSEAFCDKLLDRTGVFIAPGTIFGQQGEGYVRLSLCSHLEQMKAALHRIQTHFQPQVSLEN
jgi:LL-diaminopimelate aminotransferase